MWIIWQLMKWVCGIFILENEHVEIMQFLNSIESVSGVAFAKAIPIILQSVNFVFCSFVLSSIMFERLHELKLQSVNFV